MRTKRIRCSRRCRNWILFFTVVFALVFFVRNVDFLNQSRSVTLQHSERTNRLCDSEHGVNDRCVPSHLNFTRPDVSSDKSTYQNLDLGGRWCFSGNTSMPKPSFVKEPQIWQEVGNRNVIVYSAFLDLRPEVGGPLVRIIASGLQEEYNKGKYEFYCTLWYRSIEIPASVGPAIYDRIYPSTMHADEWTAHYILCPVPSAKTIGHPYAMSVTSESCTPRAETRNTLMVLNRKGSAVNKTSSFALCLPPIYGKLKDFVSIVEIIELHKLLGVQEVYVYIFSSDKPSTDFLVWYSSDSNSSVELVHWPVPSDKMVNYFCQHSAINDCIYRAGRSARYVSVNDLDEVIVPRKHDTWNQMMEFISKPNVGAYLFQHAYFRRNSTGEQPYLITQQSLWRTDVVVPAGNIRSKTLYEVEKTIKANIHSPYKLTSDHVEVIVPPEDAMLHHYRSEPMETFRKNPGSFRFVEDTRLLRYKQQLLKSVDAVMQTWNQSLMIRPEKFTLPT